MLKLYKFFWDYGRMGDVEGLFVADTEQVEAAIGSAVYFGEILGKHSEIYGDLGYEDLEIISDDPEKIAWLVEIIGSSTISGHNPLYYIKDGEDE